MANIGIATGPGSGIIVVDMDGACELPGELQNLPKTIAAKTSRGRHLYFRHPDGLKIGNRAKISGLPIDCRGEGGYVVAPSSLHASGIRYEWEIEPWDCEPVEASRELLAWLTAPKRASGLTPAQTPRRAGMVDWMRQARAYIAKIPPAVQGANGSGQLMAALRSIFDRFDLDNDQFRQIADEYSATCLPPWSEREIEHAIENIKKEASKRLWEGESVGNRANATGSDAQMPPKAQQQPGDATIVDVIRGYFQQRYDPTFRRGANIWANAASREVTRAEACAAPESTIIPALLAAVDFPRGETGPKRSAVPGIFRQWAPIAWADMLASLSDEADSPEIADSAADQFRATVTELMLTIESAGHVYREQNGGQRNEVQRRSLIDWCKLWAKPGRWKKARSWSLWCQIGKDGGLRVGIHQALFSQVHKGNLAPYVQRRFTQLAEMYGIGTAGRTANSRFVELTADFLAELIAGPDDANDDDDDDAGFRRANAHGASSSSSSFASSAEEGLNGVHEDQH